jgi:outer membrane protein
MALAWFLALGTGGAREAMAEAPPSPPATIGPPATQTLTLAEALAYAHEHQPALRAARARAFAERAAANIPTAQWLPTVAVTAQIFATTANNTTATYVQPALVDIPRIGATPATASGSFAPRASTLVGAGILQEVFDFGRIAAQRAAADERADAVVHGADAERLDADFAVEEAFFSVWTAHAVVQAADQAYERSRVHRDYAKRGVDSGLRSPIELTRAEADLARFDVGRVRARGGLAVARSVLSAAIGAPDPAVDVGGDPPKPPDMPALPEAMALAERRDPGLSRALAELRATERQTRAIGAEMRPDIGLTATLSGRAGGATPSSGQAAHDEGWVPYVPNWDAGLVLSWPLFDGTVAARADASRARETVRREEVGAAREQEVAAVRQSYVEVEVARQALAAQENAVLAARANWAQADARFGAGLGTAVELADAEAVRTDAEIQLALAQFDVARARAAFGRAIAEGL